MFVQNGGGRGAGTCAGFDGILRHDQYEEASPAFFRKYVGIFMIFLITIFELVV